MGEQPVQIQAVGVELAGRGCHQGAVAFRPVHLIEGAVDLGDPVGVKAVLAVPEVKDENVVLAVKRGHRKNPFTRVQSKNRPPPQSWLLDSNLWRAASNAQGGSSQGSLAAAYEAGHLGVERSGRPFQLLVNVVPPDGPELTRVGAEFDVAAAIEHEPERHVDVAALAQRRGRREEERLAGADARVERGRYPELLQRLPLDGVPRVLALLDVP